MAVLAGIDEAGFGPILGPLVVSSTVFRLENKDLESDIWDLLERSVSKYKRHLRGRILICDSKKAYSRTTGIKHIERTTLASLECLGIEVATLSELLRSLCPDCTERLRNYPWHSGTDKKKLKADKRDIEIASDVFNDNMRSNGMELLELNSQCLDVAHYNRAVENVKNKARVLFSVVSVFIKKAFEKYGGEDNLQIIVDRQGGRSRYQNNLQRMFPETQLRIIKETDRLSSYELKAGRKSMRIHFAVKADDKFLPVSLSSMISKYLRELLVANINDYFTDFCSELKPTAGYWQDGLRFIDDLKTYIPEVQYQCRQLIRSK